ncbi:MAG: class I SAM-dependent methyltransferase [Arcobacteraceae bacterium]
MNKASINHKNRQAHNWLLYDQADKYLLEYTPYYKGILLDMGCADAPYKDFFLQYADKYIGIDWTNSLHETTVDIVSDLNTKIELEDEYADTIVALNVLEHLNEPQIFLNESFRLLKPGSAMILHVPFQWWIHEAPHDYFRYTPYGLKYMLEKAGFQDIHIQPTGGFFTMWFLKMNYFSLRLTKGSKFKSKIMTFLLKPFWYLAQKLAPKFDAMHRGWSLEAQSFFCSCFKRR